MPFVKIEGKAGAIWINQDLVAAVSPAINPQTGAPLINASIVACAGGAIIIDGIRPAALAAQLAGAPPAPPLAQEEPDGPLRLSP